MDSDFLQKTSSPSDTGTPIFTIVVATYNRAQVVTRTLRTAIAQTETRWRALVIGDACTDDTQTQIAALDDARIRFLNLPQRFGEQAGPNSVGMALADTPYVAFLNHDDLWFPDHLAHALRCLETGEADLYWSRAAFFANRGSWENRTLFTEASPRGRRLEDMYHGQVYRAEPLSSWVARRDAIQRLGPMTLASQTSLFPLTDYCLRAARMGLTLHAGDAITVLKDRMWVPPPTYAHTATYAERWVEMFETGQADRVAQEVSRDLWLSEALGLNRSFENPGVGNMSTTFGAIDRKTGLNLTKLQATARGTPAKLLAGVSKRRTGHAIRHQPQLDEMIEFARNAAV